MLQARHRASAPTVTSRVPGAARPTRAVARLTSRLVVRTLTVLLVALAAYVAMEVEVFEATYPTEASRQLVTTFGEDPAVRMLAGVPAGTSIGALVVWDGGWMIQLVLGLWAVVTTARLLRGDEDAARAEVLLAGPVRAPRMLMVQLGVLAGATLLVGAVLAGTFVAAGTDLAGALAFGALVTGFGLTHMGLTALVAQVLATRGRVLAVGSIALGAAFLLRMVANSADERAWVSWLTPLGWNDQLRSFGDERWAVLLLPLGVAAGLAAGAVVLRARRDTGAGLVHRTRRERSTTVLLGGPTRFAVRTALPTSLGWAVGLAVVGVTVGGMLPSLEAYLEEDPGYAELLAMFGVDIAEISGGFLSMMGVIAGVALCLRVAWRVGAARAEEDAGRLEQLLVRPLPRWRWLAGHVVVAAVDVVLLALVTGAATWVGARVGGADVSGADAFAAMVNPLPVVAVFLGLAVALLGVVPRLVVGVTATVAMVLYVVELVGPPLDWPEAVLALSPFHHLALVPVDPVATTAALVLVGVGVALSAVGFVTFARRDLVGS
nr:hypothetical protein [uncultured Actinotalea sp.]